MPATITRDQVQARVAAALEEFGAVGEVTPEKTFGELDVDSLDLVELTQIVQDEYGVQIKGEDMPALKTVGDAVDLVIARAGA